MSYILGIDTSTTATKVLLSNKKGHVIAVAAQEYSFETPQPLWSEQSPSLWWDATIASIRQLLAETAINPAEIVGIGLTGQMHGLVLLDDQGEVLRPAILWNDQRTATQCDTIRTRLGKAQLIQQTGNDALTGFTAPKILWVEENEPEIYAKVRHILLPKDYLRYCLTGEFGTDRAGAAGTLLLDINSRDWSTTVVDALGIDPAHLPKTHEGPAITGTISSKAAEMMGLSVGTPIIAGGGDQAAQAVGVGAIQEGVAALTLGTSGVVFVSMDQPFVEPEGRLHAFCHAVPGRWHLMGVMLSAAGSLRWYRDTLAPGVDFDTLLAPAAHIAAGSDGLLFLPYLTGERTPHPDPLARGAFVGLTVRHTQAHMTRAVLEGVAFGLRDSFELVKAVGVGHLKQVRISGGGARSPLWKQMIADVLNSELVTVNTTEGAAYGAALLAGVGAGIWPSVDAACADVIEITGRTTPNAEQVGLYKEAYGRYGPLYSALKPTFDALG